MDPATKERIEETIASHRVVLFMKGERRAPRCGFSARVVGILDQYLSDYRTFDVLADPDVRQGIKEHSSWPTIPQLFVDGELVGGCDIVTEMFQSGRLEEVLGVEAVDVAAPAVTLSDRAVAALKGALGDGEHVRLEIGADFQHDLSVGTASPTDLKVQTNGLTILVSRTTAPRAEGVSIDCVRTPDGPAFRIDNPNEPPRVRQMTVEELKRKLDAGESLELLDVRTPQERQKACIEGSRPFEEVTPRSIETLDKGRLLVFLCHHGPRSQAAAEHFVSLGFTNVHNLVGGIDAWSREIDPSVPRY